jgi:hypothetical protein
MLLPQAAKQRVGQVARKADEVLHASLLEILTGQNGPADEKEKWCGAFAAWAGRLVDAVAPELLDQQGDHASLEATLMEACKWVVGRAFDPHILNSVVVRALIDAGRPLSPEQPPETVVPYRTMQDAVRARQVHWLGIGADYESPADPEQHVPVAPAVQPPPARPTATWSWDQLRITFMDDDSVVVRCPDYHGPKTFVELGFVDLRSHKPVLSWRLLRILAQEGGEITGGTRYSFDWRKVETAAADLRQRLQQAFNHADDPLLTVKSGREKGAYRARFSVRLSNSIELPSVTNVRGPLGAGPDY